MEANARKIDVFTTRVRQMILHYEEIKQTCRDLQAQLDSKDREIARVSAELEEARKDYQTLKTARMLAITDQDHEAARRRLQKLIRDVNKCITLISEQ